MLAAPLYQSMLLPIAASSHRRENVQCSFNKLYTAEVHRTRWCGRNSRRCAPARISPLNSYGTDIRAKTSAQQLAGVIFLASPAEPISFPILATAPQCDWPRRRPRSC
jgi:hypothetical protein